MKELSRYLIITMIGGCFLFGSLLQAETVYSPLFSSQTKTTSEQFSQNMQPLGHLQSTQSPDQTPATAPGNEGTNDRQTDFTFDPLCCITEYTYDPDCCTVTEYTEVVPKKWTLA